MRDGADDDVDQLYGAPTAAGGEAKRHKRAGKPVPNQAALPIDGKQLGDWVLPPIALLKQAGQQAVDVTIERRGMTLQESLASHGVGNTAGRHDGGADGHSLRARLGAGIKVAGSQA